MATVLCLFTLTTATSQTYTSLPLSDDLSSSVLASYWSFTDVQGMGTYSISDLSGGWPNFGTCSSGICSNVGASGGNGLQIYNSSVPTGSNQLNLDLHLNLGSGGTVELQQAIVDWGSGWDSLQIQLSNDGGATFSRATSVKLWLAPHSDGIWNEVTFDLSALAVSSGVALSSTYIVRYSVFLEKSGAATNPKSWPNQSVYFDNFKVTELVSLPVELVHFRK